MIKRFILGLLVVNTVNIVAQRSNSSPYSRFGIGENFESLTVEQASMGGIGVALKDVYHLNFSNPAAMADIRFATYGLGGSFTFLKLTDTNTSQKGNSVNLRYAALAFPIGRKAGFSVGLQPFSSVGYALRGEEEFDGATQKTRLSGSGGTNRLYASFGAYILEGLSVGAEASFLFGKTENNVLTYGSGVFGTQAIEELNIRGGIYKFGMQYRNQMKNKLNFYTGTALTLQSDLSASGSEVINKVTIASDGSVKRVEIRDVLSGEIIDDGERYRSALSGTISLPVKFAVGAGLGKDNKWYVGVNQEYRGTLRNLNITTDGYQFERARKFSLGGYYIPKFNSISSYWERVTYRAGVRFEKTGLLIDSFGTGQNLTSINDFGINIGFGLPMPKQLSSINIGFEYGEKGTTLNNLVKESYYNIRLSLSLNSRNWFQKRRID